MSRRGRILALLMAGALVMAACSGSKDNENAEATPDDVSTGTDQAAPEPEDTETETADGVATDGDEGDEGGAEADGSGDAESGDDGVGAEDGQTDQAESRPATDPELIATFSEQIFPLADSFQECGEAGEPGLTATDRGVTEETVSIAFMDADTSTLEALGLFVPIADEAEVFRSLMDDINRRCGGVHGRRIEVNSYEFDPVALATQDAACVAATQDDENALVVGRVVVNDGPLCITEENGHVYYSLTRAPREFFERSDDRLFTIDIEANRGIALGTLEMIERGIINAESPIGVVWADTSQDNLLAKESIVDVLDAQGLPHVDVQFTLQGVNCVGLPQAVERLRTEGVETVYALVTPVCYPALVAEAATQGWFPQWIATDHNAMTSIAGGNAQIDNGDAFDGALGFSTTLRPLGAVEYTDDVLPLWDAECNFVVNGLNDTTFTAVTPEFSGLVEVCISAWSVVKALEAAGPDLTQESLIAGFESLDQVPLRHDIVGGFGPDKHWAGPDTMHTVEWQVACGCWRPIDGPRLALPLEG